MRDFITKDSGERDEFDTGSVRDNSAQKIRPELISPFALRRIAGLYARGADKYGDRNWEKGQPMVRTTGSLFRHLLSFMCGETDEDHLAAIAWNAMALMHTEEAIELGILPGTLDDMPHYLSELGTKLNRAVAANEALKIDFPFYNSEETDDIDQEPLWPAEESSDPVPSHAYCSFCGRDQGEHDRSCNLFDRAQERERDSIAAEARIRAAIARSWKQPTAEERLEEYNAGQQERDEHTEEDHSTPQNFRC